MAIIMDGSGRWAVRRGLTRVVGHRAGVRAVRRVVRAAPGCGIGTLTLFAFSSANWQRPPSEVAALMRIFQGYLRSETPDWVARGVRVSVIGRRDRLSPALRSAIEAAEAATCRGLTLHLRLAIDYSAREAILTAVQLSKAPATLEDFSCLVAEVTHAEASTPDVDLLIRTGGEQRLSDCLLWEGSYAELVFSNRMWPDFEVADLEAAVGDFRARERRFGGVPEAAAS